MEETKEVGEIFTVECDCAPSTGYRWYLTRLDQGLSLVDFGFRCDGDVKVGAGGKAFFTFQALKEGKTALHLTKYRTFDLSTVDTGEELTYTITKAVGASANTSNVLGGWTAFTQVDGDSATVLQKALQDYVGVGYTPLVVAKQLVNGTNYLFVCNARIVYPSAQNYAVLVKVYQSLKGETEIREIVQIGHPHFMGSFGAFTQVDGDSATVLQKALQDYVGVGYTPLVVAKQLVSGRNYLFAANANVVYPGAEPYPVFVKVYQSLQGEIQITGVIDAYEYK